MTHLVSATGRLLELYMWHSQRLTSASDMEILRCAMRRAANAVAEARQWQIIEKYWNTVL